MTASNLGNVAIALAVIGYVVYRRMTWNVLDTKEMWGTPVILLGIGVYQLRELGDRPVRAVDIAFLIVGILVSLAGGALLGRLTLVRRDGDKLYQRLAGAGLALWAGYIAVRFGLGVLGHLMGATLTSGGGSIQISLGANLLAQAFVVALRSGISLPWEQRT